MMTAGTTIRNTAVSPMILIGAMSFVACSALQVGTGGAATADYYRARGEMGYRFAAVEFPQGKPPPAVARTPAEDLSHVRAALKPSVSELADALGVSRQAVYDWQNGNAVKAEHAARLADLAGAAELLDAAGLTASAYTLRRAIAAGKRLFDIVRDGGSAEAAAGDLIQIVQRERQEREKLAMQLGSRKRSATFSDDFGVPALDEH